MTVSPFVLTNPQQELASGQVVNPASAQVPDGYGAGVAMGRNNDVLTSDVHGRFFNASARGNVFVAAPSGATGRTILGFGGTTSGFCVYNPLGSGINMEILELQVSPLTATNVVAGLGLEYSTPPSAVGTAITPALANVGGRALGPVGKAAMGATIVAGSFLMWLPMMQMTTSTLTAGGSQILYKPEGALILAPGGLINICSTTSESTNVWMQHAIWAEWPV